ncbi:MAG TPA: STAS domain-containing protein [Pyrinomonadaceae bacterium]|jgi:anti-sigma B factor antagonist
MLKITERQIGDVTILDLEGNIIMGGGSAQLRDAIRRLIEEGRRKLLLNFSEVKYIDSSGIGELVSSSVILNRAEGQLKLLKIPEKVEEVLALSNILSIFEIYDDEAKALEDYSGADA